MEPSAFTGEGNDVALFNLKVFNKDGSEQTPKAQFTSYNYGGGVYFNGETYLRGDTLHSGFLPWPNSAVGIVNLYNAPDTALAAVNTIDNYQIFPFEVLPSAISRYPGQNPVQLKPVYFGFEKPVYNYKSSNDNLASVSPNGLVSFKRAGIANINVVADLLDSTYTFKIAVSVAKPLPEYLNPLVLEYPPFVELFTGESVQPRLAAFTKQGYQTQLPEGIVYSSAPLTPSRNPYIASDANGNKYIPPYSPVISIDSAGKITALRPGKAYLYAKAPNTIRAQTRLKSFKTATVPPLK